MDAFDPALERLLALETRAEGLRERQRRLGARWRALDAELVGVGEEIGQAGATLVASGRRPVEWGELTERSTTTVPEGEAPTVSQYYIERLLSAHAADLRGRLLLWGSGGVVSSVEELLSDADASVTTLGGLDEAGGVAEASLDGLLALHVLHRTWDVSAALARCLGLVRPGGVLMCSLPAVSGERSRSGLDDDYWRFTVKGTRALFEEPFAAGDLTVHGFGNLLAATALLLGIPASELTSVELDTTDRHFPVVIGVRAIRPLSAGGAP